MTRRRPQLRRVSVELDRVELAAVLLALELGAAALHPNTRAELELARARLLAALLDAARTWKLAALPEVVSSAVVRERFNGAGGAAARRTTTKRARKRRAK